MIFSKRISQPLLFQENETTLTVGIHGRHYFMILNKYIHSNKSYFLKGSSKFI